MLIKKGYSANDIVTFKIMNGDELVASVVNEHDDHYVIAQPMSVVPSQQGIGLMQALFSIEPKSEVVLKKDHVMLHNKTIDAIADHYRELTTGIKTIRNESRIIV